MNKIQELLATGNNCAGIHIVCNTEVGKEVAELLAEALSCEVANEASTRSDILIWKFAYPVHGQQYLRVYYNYLYTTADAKYIIHTLQV